MCTVVRSSGTECVVVGWRLETRPGQARRPGKKPRMRQMDGKFGRVVAQLERT